MSEAALKEIQHSLNAIRSVVEEEDAATQLAALALMLSTSESIVQTARKLDSSNAKPKTRTRTIAIPQTKVVKQQSAPQPQRKSDDGRDERERRAEREKRDERKKREKAPIQPQPPLTPQQQREQ